MELYEVMRSAFSAREFTDDPVPDELLHRLFENARFAPTGGNRQGGQVIVVRDHSTKRAIADLAAPAAKRYQAQRANGENPWNTIDPPRVTAEEIEATPPPRGLTEPVANAPVVLVVCVDLKVVASIDQDLDRVGVISGGSVYPFAWNILLAARAEGYGGTLTTMPIAEEPRLKALLDIPEHVAVAAVIPFGRPVQSLTKLRRRSVEEFTHLERWGEGSLESPS
ncbi:MAG: nitroreductase family protein [Dehalococcoidia bacterium]|jgi:nitroreductase|nr:nitroreductase family protein [Dehalococcoidia bacterium]